MRKLLFQFLTASLMLCANTAFAQPCDNNPQAVNYSSKSSAWSWCGTGPGCDNGGGREFAVYGGKIYTPTYNTTDAPLNDMWNRCEVSSPCTRYWRLNDATCVVCNPPSSGTLTTPGAICSGNTAWINGSAVTHVNRQYHWEQEIVFGSGTWTSIGGNQEDLTTPVLTSTRRFRRKVSGCNVYKESGWQTVTVTVNAQPTLGTVSTGGPVNFCAASGNFGSAVTVSGQTGSVVWDWGSNNGAWNNNWVAGTNSGVCCFPKKISNSDGRADRIRYRVTNGVCAAVTSGTIEIRNYHNVAPSSLTSNINNVCPSTAGTLTATFPDAVNMRGTVEFATSLNGAPFASVTPSAGQTVFTAAISPASTTTYYVRYKSDPAGGGGCFSTSQSVTVTTLSTANNPGAISVPAAICPGTATNVSNVTVATTGVPASAGPTYFFYYRGGPSNVPWQMFLSTPASSAALPAAVINTPGDWFVARNSQFACTGQANNATTVDIPITVYENLDAGTIGEDQIINRGTSPIPLTSEVDASGGGGLTYQWQTSPDSLTWSNIGGATSSTYSPGALVEDTYYRRAAISTAGCGTEYTAGVKITVIVAVCSGDIPPNLIEETTVAGGTGSYAYQWQASTDGSTFTDIGGATLATYDPDPVTVSTWYRRCVTSGACTECTEPVKATVTSIPGGLNVGQDLVVWLKADQGTDNIGTKWEDQSGNGHDYTTVPGPTVSTGDSSSNFNSYVEILNGGFEAPAGAELAEEYTIIMVAKRLDSDNDGRLFEAKTGNYLWGYHSGYSNALYTAGSPNAISTDAGTLNGGTHKRLQSFVRSANGTLKHHVNGKLAATHNSSASASGKNVNINAGQYVSTEDCDARVYELIIYNTALSQSELNIVESYLMTKYRLGKGHNYLSSEGAQVFDVTSSYNNDIIGLGKECYFHQKQSGSTDDSIKVYISSLAASNSDNAGSITNDISYLIMGHDGGVSSSTDAANNEVPTGINIRLEREWRVTNTNFTDSYSMKFEVNDFPSALDKTKLLVDDDGDFTNATIYDTDDGLTFLNGSIIVSGIGPSIIPVGSSKFVTLGHVGTVLPVELVSFQAVNEHDLVEIKWLTTSQYHNDYFLVQRSMDGESDWIDIEKVPGESYSNSVLSYHVQDSYVCKSCYYRLVQVDYDGTQTISDVISITNEYVTEVEFDLYPNPAENLISLEILSNSTEEFGITVYSVDGIQLFELEGELELGKNKIDIELDDLSAGLYYLEFSKRISGGTLGSAFKKL